MEKIWIVTTPPCEETSLLKEELCSGFESLMRGVSGGLALAIVPQTETDLRIMDAANLAGVSVQVILPQEKSSVLPTLPQNIRAKWDSSLSRSEIGLNILPGRGLNQNDWDDANTWKDELAEILLFPADQVGAPIDHRPSVSRDEAKGEWEFVNFPESGQLEDNQLETILRNTFRGRSRPTSLSECKTEASSIAKRWAPIYRALETLTLLLNLGPSLVLAFGALLIWKGETISVWKFGFALTASLFAWGVKSLAIHKRWLHARAIAEICRSLSGSTSILGPLYPVAARFLPDYASLARSLALSCFSKKEQIPTEDAPAFREWYLENRLDKQIAYYEPRSHRAIQFHRRIKRLFGTALVLSLASTAYAWMENLGWAMPLSAEFSKRYISGFATFAFPALAAASLGILALHESSRRAEFYGQICQRLRRRRAFLAKLHSPSSIREAIREIEEILTEEVAGWLRRRVF